MILHAIRNPERPMLDLVADLQNSMVWVGSPSYVRPVAVGRIDTVNLTAKLRIDAKQFWCEFEDAFFNRNALKRGQICQVRFVFHGVKAYAASYLVTCRSIRRDRRTTRMIMEFECH